MQTLKSWVRLTACCVSVLSFLRTPDLFAQTPGVTKSGRPALHVEVRSSVDDLWNGMRKKDPEPHGKVYYVLSLGASESEEDLKQPVDESALVAQLHEAMSAQGFRQMKADEKPDILLTVVYGRGYLKNPYLPNGVDEISSGVPIVTITSGDDVFAQRQAGYESKRQNAQLEKLFIVVRAVKYPESKEEKPKRLWQTMMIVDKPGHHDLNDVAKDMFLVGVQHFDRVLPKEGIVVSSDDPKGRVILAPIRVMETEEAAPSQKRKKK
jgi:hypothetical protein